MIIFMSFTAISQMVMLLIEEVGDELLLVKFVS